MMLTYVNCFRHALAYNKHSTNISDFYSLLPWSAKVVFDSSLRFIWNLKIILMGRCVRFYSSSSPFIQILSLLKITVLSAFCLIQACLCTLTRHLIALDCKFHLALNQILLRSGNHVLITWFYLMPGCSVFPHRDS